MHPCPSCGYCPACGRRNLPTIVPMYPSWPPPMYPSYPVYSLTPQYIITNNTGAAATPTTYHVSNVIGGIPVTLS